MIYDLVRSNDAVITDSGIPKC